MTAERTKDSEFQRTLSRFEACLEQPIVPGELRTWLTAAQESCSRVQKIWQDETSRSHEDLIAEICRQDMALAPRAQSLKTKDAELATRWRVLHYELRQLTTEAVQAESHEARLNDQVENVTASGLDLVIESRKQEAALATWYMEAFTRDRGVAD